jgi:hypothetical protein
LADRGCDRQRLERPQRDKIIFQLWKHVPWRYLDPLILEPRRTSLSGLLLKLNLWCWLEVRQRCSSKLWWNILWTVLTLLPAKLSFPCQPRWSWCRCVGLKFTSLLSLLNPKQSSETCFSLQTPSRAAIAIDAVLSPAPSAPLCVTTSVWL